MYQHVATSWRSTNWRTRRAASSPARLIARRSSDHGVWSGAVNISTPPTFSTRLHSGKQGWQIIDKLQREIVPHHVATFAAAASRASPDTTLRSPARLSPGLRPSRRPSHDVSGAATDGAACAPSLPHDDGRDRGSRKPRRQCRSSVPEGPQPASTMRVGVRRMTSKRSSRRLPTSR